MDGYSLSNWPPDPTTDPTVEECYAAAAEWDETQRQGHYYEVAAVIYCLEECGYLTLDETIPDVDTLAKEVLLTLEGHARE